MTVIVVVGTSFGDEGKGKVVDLLSEKANTVVRYAGGANAGHTLVVNGHKTILRLIPSGVLHSRVNCILGSGMVIDPFTLLAEYNSLKDSGLDLHGRLQISENAHVVLPYHREIDAWRESGSGAIGTTKRGIGPAYEDKAARRGLRFRDLFLPSTLIEKIKRALSEWNHIPSTHKFEAEKLAEDLIKATKEFDSMTCDTVGSVNWAIDNGDRVLLEGAQGALLDIDHGSYPYVTSSSAVAGGACAGAGVGPSRIDKVIGVTKAYTTRVGDGPFTTEIRGEVADRIREVGAEYGSVTKRPRRVGWLDLPALKYAAQVNGLDGLIITKLDVLTGMDVQMAENHLPLEYMEDFNVNCVGDYLPKYDHTWRWDEDISQCTAWGHLPSEVKKFILRIEKEVGVPVYMVSVGSDRNQTVIVREVW